MSMTLCTFLFTTNLYGTKKELNETDNFSTAKFLSNLKCHKPSMVTFYISYGLL